MEEMIKRGRWLLIEMTWVIMGILVVDTVIFSFLIGRVYWEFVGRIIYTGVLFYLTIRKRKWARIILGIVASLSTFGVFLAFTASFYVVTRVIALVLALFYGLVAYNLFFSDDINTYMNSEE